MKILLLLAVVAVCAAIRTNHKFAPPEKQLQDQFVQFVQAYNKQYDQAEFNKRYGIFRENVMKISKLNQEAKTSGSSATFGVNKFADLTDAEFAKLYKGYKKTNATVRAGVYAPSSVPAAPPASFDWRTQGVVTAVKNQEQCGSCWAFSATEGVESAWKLAGHTLDVLAPQQIVDCDTSDAGCNGGDLPTAFAYVHREGLERETNYPYRGIDESCKYNAADVDARISGFQYATTTRNEPQMQTASFAHGPLSICVDAATWQTYTGGIISSNCGQSLDHCVQIVGWATSSSGVDYWIIRNSWGTDWGISGYLYVARNKNLCGVADEATYVVI
jgi:C1A family cysteine protease